MDNDLWFYSFLLGEDIRSFRTYMSTVSEGLKKEQVARCEELAKIKYKGPPEGESDWAESHGGKFFELEVAYPNYLWRGAFLTLYFFLEDKLIELCTALRKQFDHKLRVQDLKDSGITAAKTYIEKVCGLPVPTNSVEWQALKKYNLVRNCLVHNGGAIPLDRIAEQKYKELADYCSATDGLELLSGYIVQVKEEFAMSVLETIGGFMNKLLKGFERKLPDPT